MSSVHSNISIFVPHIGCPNRCSFCDQRSITGIHRAPHAEEVQKTIETALASPHYNPETTEIAFFGGSFTAINRNYMIELLKTAYAYIERGLAAGIRISTRPDAITPEILEILKQYRVTSVELGAQSMDDHVLRLNNRGHSAEDVRAASALIRSYGFSLGLQMMTGLYGDNDETALRTAAEIAAIHPDTVRIYPTIVLKNTDLAALYCDHIYEPQSLESAVRLSAKLLLLFRDAGIRVIRLGLHAIESGSYVAGPWHPAFSELCQSAVYLKAAQEKLKNRGNYVLYVGRSDVSKMVGQKRSNLDFLRRNGYVCRVKTDDALGLYEVRTEREENGNAAQFDSNSGI